MTRLAIWAAAIGLASALAQPPPGGADRFDAASVKPAGGSTPIRRHSAARIGYEGIGFPELIEKAFGLPEYRIVWPDWIAVPHDRPTKERFDVRFFTIEARMPSGSTPEEFQRMLQNLLVDRFGLAFHRETRPLDQYEVTFAAGGPKMPLAKPVSEGPLSNIPDDSENVAAVKHMRTHGGEFNRIDDTMREHGDFTVAGLAYFLTPYLPHPMADRTGSDEYYAVDLLWNWNPFQTPAPTDGTMNNRASDSEARDLFSVMEKKLGLKVTLRSLPTEMLVIDHLNHEATEN